MLEVGELEIVTVTLRNMYITQQVCVITRGQTTHLVLREETGKSQIFVMCWLLVTAAAFNRDCPCLTHIPTLLPLPCTSPIFNCHRSISLLMQICAEDRLYYGKAEPAQDHDWRSVCYWIKSVRRKGGEVSQTQALVQTAWVWILLSSWSYPPQQVIQLLICKMELILIGASRKCFKKKKTKLQEIIHVKCSAHCPVQSPPLRTTGPTPMTDSC